MSVDRGARSIVVSGASAGALALAANAHAAVIEISQDASFSVPVGGGNQFEPFDITGDGDFDIDLKLRDNAGGDSIVIENKNADSFFLLDEFGDPNFSALSLIDDSRVSTGFRTSLVNLGPNDAAFGEPDISGFLGVSLLIEGNRHFAWIEISVTEEAGSVAAQVIRSGFEDVPGVGILAGSTQSLAPPIPVPSSLLLLASGAVGLAALRRRRNGAAA